MAVINVNLTVSPLKSTWALTSVVHFTKLDTLSTVLAVIGRTGDIFRLAVLAFIARFTFARIAALFIYADSINTRPI